MATHIVKKIYRLSSKYEHSFMTGWTMFESKTLVQCLRSLQTVTAPPKTTKRKEVPVELDSVIVTKSIPKKHDQAKLLQDNHITSFEGLSGKGNKLFFEKENIWTVPNLLCLFRIAASPYLGYLILSEKYLFACGILGVAAVTDLLDGVIARRYPSQSSKIGSILDPFADKCLIAFLSVSLTVIGLIPLPLTVLFISRDLSLIAGAFYVRYKTIPKPRTWSNFWNVQRSAVQVTPSSISKLNTTLQLVLVGLTVGAPVFQYVDHPVIQTLWYITALTTISSGFSYIFQMKGFKILQLDKDKQN